jgi:hypothetical protein
MLASCYTDPIRLESFSDGRVAEDVVRSNGLFDKDATVNSEAGDQTLARSTKA